MAFFDNLGKKITDVSQSTIQKGKDIADTAKYNSMISEEEKKMADIYSLIGQKYFELYQEEPGEQFVESVELIKEAQKNIQSLKDKIMDLKGVTKCPNCGAEVANDSAFCAGCGTKIEKPQPVPMEAASTVKLCVKCGAVLKEDSRFCTTCGTPVEQIEVENQMEAEKPAESTMPEADSVVETEE